MIFVDEARIFLKAGDGGKGCESFYSDKLTRYPRPDGGHGGNGASIHFVSDPHIQTLLDFRFCQHYKGQRGGHASSKNQRGRDGEDLVLKVPVGTLIWDVDTELLIRDLVEPGQTVLVAKGGRGGRGNIHNRPVLPPGVGEERTVRLELKIIADVGIVGIPNAGKSTIISAISKVRSKIANYPFTTKQPILGIVKGDDFFTSPEARSSRRPKSGDKTPRKIDLEKSRRIDFVVADLPGLIEGAHLGKGLGDRFLKHAERTKILMHIIDMAGSEGQDPLEDYETINNELESFSDELLIKHRIIVANKMDLPEAKENLKRFKRKYKKLEIFPVSAINKEGLEDLVETVRDILWQERSREKSSVLS